MGIDIYARWKGQTKRERDAQCTGFSVCHGHVGYLREAYHGGPYVTRFLVREAFEAPTCEAAIPASLLQSRLPQAVVLALFRHHILYGDGARPERLEDATPEDVIAKVEALFAEGGEIAQAKSGEEGDRLARQVPREAMKQALEHIAARKLPDFALAFVDFVTLCERMERKTGESCTVYASY